MGEVEYETAEHSILEIMFDLQRELSYLKIGQHFLRLQVGRPGEIGRQGMLLIVLRPPQGIGHAHTGRYCHDAGWKIME